LPLSLPPALWQYGERVVKGAVRLAIGLVVVLVLLVLFLAVTPAVAAGQVSGANQALKLAASRQDKVDAAFTQALTVRSSPADPTAAKAYFDKTAKTVNDGLGLVQADEGALTSFDQRLTVLQWIAPSRRASAADARHHLSVALAGLKQADQALTAASNELRVIQPYNEAIIDYAKIAAAFAKHDLVAAGAPYPDAQQKIDLAISNSHAAGLPPQIAKQVSSFSEVLMNTESLIQAMQAKDTAGIKKYTDARNAALAAMASPGETVPADYETKTFGPMQKAYDTAMKALKSAS
jgi:hypothetical protein